jgi:hypothetical protein
MGIHSVFYHSTPLLSNIWVCQFLIKQKEKKKKNTTKDNKRQQKTTKGNKRQQKAKDKEK